MPRHPHTDPVVWRSRDWNKEADWLANWAMDHEQDFSYSNPMLDVAKISNLMGWSDGGSRLTQR
eukprot:11617123-Karenia_brevis.AAC.1